MAEIVYLLTIFFFFFQAEDGIRDYKVTGVQTCALPISPDAFAGPSSPRSPLRPRSIAPRNITRGISRSAVRLPAISEKLAPSLEIGERVPSSKWRRGGDLLRPPDFGG